MNTGLPRSAARDALAPVTVAPAVAGAGRRVSAAAVGDTDERQAGQKQWDDSTRHRTCTVPIGVRSVVSNLLRTLRVESLARAGAAQDVAGASDTEDMRRILALSSTLLLLSLAAVGTSAAALPGDPSTFVIAGPVAPGRAIVGRCRRSGSSRLRRSSVPIRPRSGPPIRSRAASSPAALAAWGKRAVTPADPTRLVTMRELDAQLVGALGLSEAARRIRLAALAAGLAPTSRLGTETVARLLGLRLNHPQGQDELELLPNQPATRAEAAYSLARALKLSSGQLAWLDQLSQTFSRAGDR